MDCEIEARGADGIRASFADAQRIAERAAKEAPQQAEPAAAARGARIDAATALSMLGDGMREVVVLSVLQGLPHGEISEILGIPVGTVKSRLSIALHRLRDAMQGDEP